MEKNAFLFGSRIFSRSNKVPFDFDHLGIIYVILNHQEALRGDVIAFFWIFQFMCKQIYLQGIPTKNPKTHQ